MNESVLNQLEEGLTCILFTRYFSVAGLVALLWDHCLTFDQERRLIWPSRASFVKWIFLCNRYTVPVILVVQAHSMSGISSWGLSDNFCKIWTITFCLLYTISLAIAQGLFTLKLWQLWGGRRTVILATISAFLVTQGGSVIFVILIVRDLWSSMRFYPGFSMCIIINTPRTLRFLWAWNIIFELFLMFMVFLNALSLPRKSHKVLTKTLYRDGICFFVVTNALSWFNFILTISAPTSLAFLVTYCGWAVVTTIIARMVLNLRDAEVTMRELEKESTIPLSM